MNYPMYGNNNQYFMQNLQDMKDRIEKQMQQIQMQNQNQNQMQMQQPIPQVTQNFQIAPTQNANNNELESKYAENIDEVKNTFVIKTGVFVNKDFSTLWIKDVSGNIRTFKTEEIIEMDDKDKEIFMLRKQIEELKSNRNVIQEEGDVSNVSERINSNINESVANKKSQRVSNSKYSNAKQ